MFFATNFGLVLRICIVNTIIFIKKNIDKLVQDQFLKIIRIISMIKLAMLKKLCLVFFFKFDLKNVIKYPRMCNQAF